MKKEIKKIKGVGDYAAENLLKLLGRYDGLALATASGVAAPVTGAQLRDFWRTYPGVTRVDLLFTRQLVGALGLTLSGRNLLDVQRGEPDDLTVLPGRTVTAGLTARF